MLAITVLQSMAIMATAVLMTSMSHGADAYGCMKARPYVNPANKNSVPEEKRPVLYRNLTLADVDNDQDLYNMLNTIKEADEALAGRIYVIPSETILHARDGLVRRAKFWNCVDTTRMTTTSDSNLYVNDLIVNDLTFAFNNGVNPTMAANVQQGIQFGQNNQGIGAIGLSTMKYESVGQQVSLLKPTFSPVDGADTYATYNFAKGASSAPLTVPTRALNTKAQDAKFDYPTNMERLIPPTQQLPGAKFSTDALFSGLDNGGLKFNSQLDLPTGTTTVRFSNIGTLKFPVKFAGTNVGELTVNDVSLGRNAPSVKTGSFRLIPTTSDPAITSFVTAYVRGNVNLPVDVTGTGATTTVPSLQAAFSTFGISSTLNFPAAAPRIFVSGVTVQGVRSDLARTLTFRLTNPLTHKLTLSSLTFTITNSDGVSIATATTPLSIVLAAGASATTPLITLVPTAAYATFYDTLFTYSFTSKSFNEGLTINVKDIRITAGFDDSQNYAFNPVDVDAVKVVPDVCLEFARLRIRRLPLTGFLLLVSPLLRPRPSLDSPQLYPNNLALQRLTFTLKDESSSNAVIGTYTATVLPRNSLPIVQRATFNQGLTVAFSDVVMQGVAEGVDTIPVVWRPLDTTAKKAEPDCKSGLCTVLTSRPAVTGVSVAAVRSSNAKTARVTLTSAADLSNAIAFDTFSVTLSRAGVAFAKLNSPATGFTLNLPVNGAATTVDLPFTVLNQALFDTFYATSIATLLASGLGRGEWKTDGNPNVPVASRCVSGICTVQSRPPSLIPSNSSLQVPLKANPSSSLSATLYRLPLTLTAISFTFFHNNATSGPVRIATANTTDSSIIVIPAGFQPHPQNSKSSSVPKTPPSPASSTPSSGPRHLHPRHLPRHHHVRSGLCLPLSQPPTLTALTLTGVAIGDTPSLRLNFTSTTNTPVTFTTLSLNLFLNNILVATIPPTPQSPSSSPPKPKVKVDVRDVVLEGVAGTLGDGEWTFENIVEVDVVGECISGACTLPPTKISTIGATATATATATAPATVGLRRRNRLFCGKSRCDEGV
ncbi:hypothetical protein BC829DRAFT_437778 [Chytridium lagenaria]|nr:hypothetical protein BC829DRAFT_437778 [Chytridium lagenaria]